MFILSFVNITPFGMPISCRRRLKDPETPCLLNHARLHIFEDGLLELTLDLMTVSGGHSVGSWVCIPSGQSRQRLTRRGVRGEHQGRTWVP
jgi:hypothetical protein